MARDSVADAGRCRGIIERVETVTYRSTLIEQLYEEIAELKAEIQRLKQPPETPAEHDEREGVECHEAVTVSDQAFVRQRFRKAYCSSIGSQCVIVFGSRELSGVQPNEALAWRDAAELIRAKDPK